MASAQTPAWYAPAASVRSLGSTAERPGSLAGLHEARRENLAQFFTPLPVAALMWRVATALLPARGGKFSVLDTSVGSGRLLAYARPEAHRLFGVDIHQESVQVLARCAEAAGFEADFRVCAMEDIHPIDFDLALINPPFSIHLESPAMRPYPCCAHGRFGPGSAAPSHAYALAQALEAATIVVALLPITHAREIAQDQDMDRLLATLVLPAGSFREEGTEVATAVSIFGPPGCQAERRWLMLQDLDAMPELPAIESRLLGRWGRGRLNQVGFEPETPAVVTPVTGNPEVRVAHDGRRIRLGFACGFVEARVSNALMKERIEAYRQDGVRHPRGTRYTGQGVLDIEVHLMQSDPMRSLHDFFESIRAAGGEPLADQGFLRYFSRRVRASQIARTPLRHTVFTPSGMARDSRVVGIARMRHIVEKRFGAPVVDAGDSIEFDRGDDGQYYFELKGRRYALSADQFIERFEATVGGTTGGWTTVHQGIAAAWPSQYAHWKAKARRLGIHEWLSWEFQCHDAVELAMKGSGIGAWTMGLGKARLAVALILLTGVRRGLICVEAQLVPEMVRELNGLPIPQTDWQVIDSPARLESLCRINLVSYERLRMPIGEGKRIHHTYAGRLRRRIGCLVADEGHLLANATSAQSRALWQLCAKHRFVLTGTPAPNYPRDLLPLMAFVGGDATAAQPYGLYRGYLEPNWRKSMAYAQRGIDAFRENFVVVQWYSNEFAEDLRNGAKREIPRLDNVDAYRRWLAPWVKRRLTEEPEVASHVRTPQPTLLETEIAWDPAHLAHYLEVSEEFARWYRKAKSGEDPKKLNLITLLARIQAVQFACDYPQHPTKYSRSFHALTSKQRYAIERLAKLSSEGHKTILYADSPGQLELIARHLRLKHGVEPVVFHGGIPIKQRTRELDERFRFGDCPVLLASLSVTQTGLNLWQADRALFMNRSWSSKTEAQALFRLLRPQQRRDVVAEFLMLPGGINAYQAQMVAFKADAMRAGLDWGMPEFSDVAFEHIDTLLGRFARGYAESVGLGYQDFKTYLEAQCKEAA